MVIRFGMLLLIRLMDVISLVINSDNHAFGLGEEIEGMVPYRYWRIVGLVGYKGLRWM